MIAPSLKQFGVFLDPYYWRTAILIARTNLLKQYRNSFLGKLWTLLQPLTMLLVYAAIMPMIMRFPASDYVVYIICTLPLWGLIYNVMILSSLSLLTQGETLKRCMISSTIFPVADVLRQLYTYVVAFSTMYFGAMLLGLTGSLYVVLVPLYLIPVILTLMGLAVGIAFLAPYVRDIGEAIMVGMNVMLWFSAVIYPISAVPEHLRWAIEWNPFYILLKPIIALCYEHHLPDTIDMIKLLSLMTISVTAGYALYRTCRRNFVYYL